MIVTNALYPLLTDNPPKIRGSMVNIRVNMAPISTTNMTGLRIIERGSSLRIARQIAVIKIFWLNVRLCFFIYIVPVFYNLLLIMAKCWTKSGRAREIKPAD